MIKPYDKVKIIDIHPDSGHYKNRHMYIGTIGNVGVYITKHLSGNDFYDAVVGDRFFYGVKLEKCK